MSENIQKGQIEFPVSYVLKVIFQVGSEADRHITNLEALLTEMAIPHQDSRVRNSGKGRYVSISTPIKVEDRETYEKLYRRLEALDGVKCAI